MSPDDPIKSAKKLWRVVIASTISALAIIGGFIGIYTFWQSYSRYNLAGQWTITNTIETTTDSHFRGLKLGYEIFLTQAGTNLAGTGEKVSENGKPLPPTAHTPISMNGTISGNNISATFQERGTERKTEGVLKWTYNPQTQTLSGTFTSTAASASGPSRGQRVAQ